MRTTSRAAPAYFVDEHWGDSMMISLGRQINLPLTMRSVCVCVCAFVCVLRFSIFFIILIPKEMLEPYTKPCQQPRFTFPIATRDGENITINRSGFSMCHLPRYRRCRVSLITSPSTFLTCIPSPHLQYPLSVQCEIYELYRNVSIHHTRSPVDKQEAFVGCCSSFCRSSSVQATNGRRFVLRLLVLRKTSRTCGSYKKIFAHA